MSEELYQPPEWISSRAHIASMEQYREMYEQSINNPEEFWAEQANRFCWFKKWDQVRAYNYDVNQGNIKIEWFKGGKCNITSNCLDRHLETKGEQIAIIWEGNEPGENISLTYKELHMEVCKFANVLKNHGVKKGDRVSIYMPMVVELAIAMLACARLGAVHSIVFGGFSPTALSDRIVDSSCKILITTDGGYRGSKPIAIKLNADEAIRLAEKQGVRVHTCIVVKRVGDKIPITMQDGRDVWWHEEMSKADPVCEPEVMDSEDPLFILYTSGSTGKPKGVQHSTAGYMIFTALTHRYIFDYHNGDIWWCTADIGWVTGHSYIIYGPLANGATTVMFEGVPTYPDAGRFWDVVDRLKVTQFYT
ncbi:MAG: AMP-binding protein, partial [Nitrospinota bacterium]|nr:AMP-binding protein [Nitrospinota bacterium]